MEDLQGAAVRVTPERERADEWAVVLAATGIPHRLRRRPDGWALIVAPLDAHAALDALDGYDRERQDERADTVAAVATRSEEHTSELQSPCNLVCRLLLE